MYIHGRKNIWTVNSPMSVLTNIKRKQLPLKPPALPRFCRHSNLKSRHKERHYIFGSFKPQKVNNIRAKRYDAREFELTVHLFLCPWDNILVFTPRTNLP